MADSKTPKTVIVYQNRAGKEPYTDWRDSLRDPVTHRRIARHILCMEQGHHTTSNLWAETSWNCVFLARAIASTLQEYKNRD